MNKILEAFALACMKCAIDESGPIKLEYYLPQAKAMLAHLQTVGLTVAPLQSNEAMNKAAEALWWLDFDSDEEVYLRVTATQARQIYCAMIAAIPKPPA